MTASGYNVLFIISDQHQRKVAGCYGNTKVKTPNIDRLAAEGTTFEQAYCQQPICGPSRACILTGTHAHTCDAFSHQERHVLPESFPTMGSVFREAGYRTGAIGKLHVQGEDKEKRDLGFDDRSLRFYTYGMADYEEAIGKENVDRYIPTRKGSTIKNAGKYNHNNEPITLADDLIYDKMVTDRCISFMETNKDNPFFLWMGLEKPHPAWYAPAEYHEMYNPADMDLPESRRLEHKNLPVRYQSRVTSGGSANLIKGFSKEQQQNVIASYYANVSYMDHQVGRALDTLDRLNLREKTIVVYTSDHGEHLMEHRLFQKHGMYEASVGVPLVISCPGTIPENIRKKTIVQLIDLFPTYLAMNNMSASDELEGKSLKNLLLTEEEEDREAFCEYYPGKFGAERMVRSGPWKYAYTHGDMGQLYNMETDPDEMNNLVGQDKYKDIEEKLKARVFDGWEIDEFDYLGEGAQASK